MKNYIIHKNKYNTKFADVMTDKFRNLKYGITTCHKHEDVDLIIMRKELSDWQSSGDYSTLSEVRTEYKKWLPVNITCEDMCYININVNSGSKSYHVTPAAAVWTFVHNLGFNPNVTTTDESKQEIVGIVDYLNNNTIQITFSQPVAGYAYLS
jgi:hypothetical protein